MWLGPPLAAMQHAAFPVLRMTSCFHTMERIGQNQTMLNIRPVRQVAAPAIPITSCLYSHTLYTVVL